MKTITAQDANQNFSKVLAEVEQGETVLITKKVRRLPSFAPAPTIPAKIPSSAPSSST